MERSSIAALFAVAYSRQTAAVNEYSSGGLQMNPSQGVPLTTYESHVPDYVPAYRASVAVVRSDTPADDLFCSC